MKLFLPKRRSMYKMKYKLHYPPGIGRVNLRPFTWHRCDFSYIALHARTSSDILDAMDQHSVRTSLPYASDPQILVGWCGVCCLHSSSNTPGVGTIQPTQLGPDQSTAVVQRILLLLSSAIFQDVVGVTYAHPRRSSSTVEVDCRCTLTTSGSESCWCCCWLFPLLPMMERLLSCERKVRHRSRVVNKKSTDCATLEAGTHPRYTPGR